MELDVEEIMYFDIEINYKLQSINLDDVLVTHWQRG